MSTLIMTIDSDSDHVEKETTKPTPNKKNSKQAKKAAKVE
jgi:hypothetical protein